MKNDWIALVKLADWLETLPRSTWGKGREGENVIEGATCTKCGEHNEYAEKVAGFICYGCRGT